VNILIKQIKEKKFHVYNFGFNLLRLCKIIEKIKKKRKNICIYIQTFYYVFVILQKNKKQKIIKYKFLVDIFY